MFNKMTMTSIADDVDITDKEATPIKFDIIGNLPIELVEKIFFNLTPEVLRSAVSCCLRWKDAISMDYFWRAVCKREDYLEVEESQRSEFYSKFLKRYNYWQGVYWYNWTLGQNWVKGHYKEVTYEIKESCNSAFYEFSDDIFIVRSICKTKLFVYKWTTTEFKRAVLSLRLEPGFDAGDILKSGKYLSHVIVNKSLTVWDYVNETIVFDGSFDNVTAMYVFENLFVLETEYNEKLQVVNIETLELEYECRGLCAYLIFMDGRMVFLTHNQDINVLNWDDKSLVTLTCCSYQATKFHKFLVKKDTLISFCGDDILKSRLQISLCVWNIATKLKLYSIICESLYLDDADFMNNYLYLKYFQIRNDDGNILENFTLVDYTKGTIIASMTDLDTNALVSNGQLIITCRSDKLSLWCSKTRDFICDLDFTLKADYVYRSKLVMNKTKLAYIITNCNNSVLLHLRDYEI